MTESFLTVQEVAERLRISAKSVRRMIEAHDLEAVRLGTLYRIPADGLERRLARPAAKP